MNWVLYRVAQKVRKQLFVYYKPRIARIGSVTELSEKLSKVLSKVFDVSAMIVPADDAIDHQQHK